MEALALAASLAPRLIQLIQEAIDNGAKDEREAKRLALEQLAKEHALEPTLPKVQQLIEDARRPAAERDADKK